MKTIKIGRLSALAASVLCVHQAYGLESLDDADLQQVTAQDGVQIVVSGKVKADNFYWQEDGRELQFRNLNLAATSLTDPTLATISLDIGSSNPTASALPAVGISVNIAPFLFTVGEICLAAANAAACPASSSFGEMAIRTNNNSTVSFFNTNGFFDATTSNARLRWDINDAEVYLAQTFSGRRNLLILNNIIARARFDGKLSIGAAEGIRQQGTLSLIRSGTEHGFQFDFYHNENVASGFTTTGAKGIARIGLSGTISNYDVRLAPDSGAAVVVGGGSTQGVKMSASGVLSKGNFILEVGEAGAGANTMQFSQWVDFSNGAALVPSSPDITTGDIYLNLISSGSGLLNFPSSTFGALTAPADALGLSVRGLNFQAYPKVISFYDVDNNITNPQNWSLITTLHNVNANLLLMGGGHPNATVKRGIGFDFTASTTARNGSGSEGTHLLIADPAVGTYFGWRNIAINAQVSGGQMYVADTVTDGVAGLQFSAEALKINASGQFAIGSLPNGSSVTSVATTGHLAGLAVNIESGKDASNNPTLFTFSPPTSGNYIGFSASLNLADTALDANSVSDNNITFSEPANNAQVQLGNLTGKLNIVNGKIDMASNAVTFSSTLDFSPDAAGVFRIGDVQFISDAGTTYRVGEFVVPSGQMYTKLTIKPQL